MPRNRKPAVVTLRMSGPLRDSLHAAAQAAGCSLNQYAIQVLAAAAGDPAEFRQRKDTASPPVVRDAIEEITDLLDRFRDRIRYPATPAGRRLHIRARKSYLASKPLPLDEMSAHVRRLDNEDPNFYIRWHLAAHPDEVEWTLEQLRAA